MSVCKRLKGTFLVKPGKRDHDEINGWRDEKTVVLK